MDAIADIRKDYRLKSFSEEDGAADPLVQFREWWDEALAAKIEEPNAMTLATVNENGRPSARIVLLKGLSDQGFEFFTNYESHKGNDISQNSHAALVFFWKELQRQVRVEGITEKVSASASDEYFKSRPSGSRIGAWASPQSRVLSSRAELDENVASVKSRFGEGAIPRPPFWGGYNVKPVLIEFWQGRASRLHDRLQYTRVNEGWKLQRLAP